MLPTPARHLQIQFQQVADASNPRICICKFISNKLQMLPTPARHLQIQFQHVADDSDPRICIYKSNSSKLQMLPTPARHLQIQFQQVADDSDPDQASANPIPTSCRCFRPRPGICKFISSKLQMLPRPEFTPICICISNSSKLQMLPTPARHLQIQFQQVADASNPDQASANPIPASCRYFQP